MNCEGIRKLLSEGRPLSGAANAHLESCAGCRALLHALEPSNENPDPQQIEIIRRQITSNLRPVRPFPSNRKLVLSSLAFFVLFSCVAATLPGYYGFRAFSMFQKFAYYGAICVIALVFSATLVQQLIPGARRRISSPLAVLISFASLILVVSVLFRHFDLTEFLRYGLPCFKTGLISALIFGIASGLLIRKGFVTSPLETGLLAGLFSGLAGFAVLALHCSFQNATHILVWHLGPMLVAALIGTAIASIHRRIA